MMRASDKFMSPPRPGPGTAVARPARGRFAVSRPAPAYSLQLTAYSFRKAFTLVELVVVIAIILILIAIAAPAVGPAMASNYRMQAIHALNSTLSTAQTFALSNTTDVGIRIERAAQLNSYGRMDKSTGAPKWLDHQQIRYVIFGANQDPNDAYGEDRAFRYIKESKITALPSTIWLAPAEFAGDATTPGFGPRDFYTPSGTALLDPDNQGAAGYYPFDTFYIVFSSKGLVRTFESEDLYYMDETQKVEEYNPPWIMHPQDSSMGAVLYERKKLESAPTDLPGLLDFLNTNGQSLYVNRFLGGTVESK